MKYSMQCSMKKVGILIIILGIIILFLNFLMIDSKNNGISNKTAIETEATIIDNGIIIKHLRRLGKARYYEYSKMITYKYFDNYGNFYIKDQFYRSLNYNDVYKNYLVGENFLITYNKDCPNISIWGEINSFIFPHDFLCMTFNLLGYAIIVLGIYAIIQKKYKNFQFNIKKKFVFNNNLELAINLCISLFLISSIIGCIYFKKYIISIICICIFGILHIRIYKKNKIPKELILEVIVIEYIDYEREKVIFKDQSGIEYYYLTDFGEEFKIGKKYKLETKNKNIKKEKINRDNKNLIIFHIVNTEKNRFKSYLPINDKIN